MKNCCKDTSDKTCIRKDKKEFKLPRRFTKKRCLEGVHGYSMRSSCAPYHFCKKGGRKSRKKRFLYNPHDPKKSFDVYIDKDPSDTIPIKYTTVDDVNDTIKKLEHLYKTKQYSHKRIWQVGMIMKVRLEAMKKHKKTLYSNAKNVSSRYNLANRYFKFLGKRSKVDGFDKRSKMTF
tara:strand:- start:141 stop:671 length:531 start_codon:yes stop_codon:yes gene_type:complete